MVDDMKIGEVIRKYRKEKEMTQEEMAGYLGVSAPAVNKWEKGVSFPDITLLGPIARLLGISTDILLSYHEELTDAETNRIIEEACTKIKGGDYDDVFRWAEQQIQEYPNCDNLTLTLTQILDSYRAILGLEEPEKYDEKIRRFYERLMDSDEAIISQKAALALFYFSLKKDEYDKAEEYLNRIPERICDPKRQRALLCKRQGKQEEAYRMYEKFLIEDYSNISLTLNALCALALEEDDTGHAEYIIEKQRGLAELFEMGRYQQIGPEIALAIDLHDKERILRVMEEAVHSIKDIFACHKSPLYAHIDFKNPSPENIILMLKTGLENDAELDFLRDDPRYMELLLELKQIDLSK